jgi:hypothetical protein
LIATVPQTRTPDDPGKCSGYFAESDIDFEFSPYVVAALMRNFDVSGVLIKK